MHNMRVTRISFSIALLFLLSLHSAVADIPGFPDAQCPDGSHEIGPREIIGQTDRSLLIQDPRCHDQGATSTCFAHSSTVALNAFLKSQHLAFSEETKSPPIPKDLHTLEAFARAGLPITKGGFDYEFLWKLRHIPMVPQGIALSLATHSDAYEDFYKILNQTVLPSPFGLSSSEYLDCRTKIHATILTRTPQMDQLIQELNKVFLSDLSPSKHSKSQHTSDRPQYQIKTWCYSDKASIMKKLHTHFASSNPLPLTIAICTHMSSGVCESLHGVTVTGIQKLNCSRTKEHIFSAEVYNSWGDGKIQIDLETLSQSILNSGDLFSEISPCSEREACLDQIANEDDPHSCALYAYSAMGEANHIKRLLTHPKLNPNFSLSNKVTPLSIAAQEGHADVVKALLEDDRVDPNLGNQNQATPLLIAAESGHIDVVKALLHSSRVKVYPNLPTIQKVTPLSVAAEKGHTQIVSELLQTPGINPNLADSDQTTPLYAAAQNGHLEIVHLLLKAPGILPSFRRRSGATPLFIAAQNGHTQVVEALLEHSSIDPNLMGGNGATPLFIAVKNGRTDVVKTLLKDPRTLPFLANAKGVTPLDLATQKGFTEIAELLRERLRETSTNLRQE